MTPQPEPAPRHPVLEALEAIEDVAILVDEYLDTLTTVEARLEFAGQVEDLLKTVKYIAEAANAAVVALTPDVWKVRREGGLPVPGGGVFKIGGGRERKAYRNPELLATAGAAIREQLGIVTIVTSDGETGDAAPIFETVAKVLGDLTGATAPSFNSWRTGIAKGLGIKLDEFCDKEETPLTYRIESRRPPSGETAER